MMNNLFAKNLIGERKKIINIGKKSTSMEEDFLMLAMSQYIQGMLLLRSNLFKQ
jgi:hypothetical protein